MKKTIEDINVSGKRVFLRVDFNIPLDDSGNILDASRITAELPTIKYLLRKGARLIICTHIGRPKGDNNAKLSTVCIAKYLVNILNCKIRFSPAAIGEIAKKKVAELQDGEVLVLENIRFYPEEEENSPLFASRLAELADIYVNDAFGTAHRKHASTYGVAKLLPSAVGYLMGKEINTIESALENPERPLLAILGGSKISDKLSVVSNLVKKCNVVLIGGGMAYTFMKAQGTEIGKSLFEEGQVETAKAILSEAEKSGVNIVLPVDHICSNVFSPSALPIKIKTKNIPVDLLGLDIGKKTTNLFCDYIKNAKTIIWNGPIGVFEFDAFRKGTKKIAKAVSKANAKTIVGGGDSIAALSMLGLTKQVYHISTGGGASMKLIAGEVLPGVSAISDK